MSADAIAQTLPATSSLKMTLRFWPLVLFFSIAMILNPLVWVLMGQSSSAYLQFAYFGVMFGELILVGIIAGLVGKHWLFGYAAGLAIAIIGMFVIWQITDFHISAFRQLPWFWRACHIPGTLFLACIPLLALRITRHWRISLERGNSALRLEDIFIFTSIVGCVIVLLITPTSVASAFANLASRYDNILDSSNLIRDEIRFAGWGALSLFLASPLAFMLLDRNKNLASRWKSVLIHSLLVLIVGLAILTWLSGSLTRISQFMLAICVAYFMVVVGLVCVRASGFQLHGKYGRSLHFDDTAATRSGAITWVPRIASASIVILAIYVTLTAGNLQRQAKQAIGSFAEVKESFQQKGGSIDGRTHRTASYCVFGDQMDDRDLAQIQNCIFLEQLDLSDSKVTDEGFEHVANLTQIRDFDFSNTAIGDATLEAIAKKYSRLRSLNVSNTKVTSAGICKLVKEVRVGQIFLNDNHLADSDFENFDTNLRTVIHLYGNPITEATVVRLAAYRGLGLGRNQLSTDWPEKLEKLPEVLYLQGSDMNDMTCASFAAKTKFFDRLVIEDTAITDSGLKELAKIDLNTLEIGKGLITDDGLKLASINVTYQLKLSGSLTGNCLREWKLPNIESLDLSDSQVSDSILEAITIPASVRRFGVGNTSVTDQGLTCIRGMQLDMVNAARTTITDQGLSEIPARIVFVEVERFNSQLQSRAQQSGVSLIQVVPPVRILDDARQENRAAILASARKKE